MCVRFRDPVCQLAVPGGPPWSPTQPGAPVCGLRDVTVWPGRGACGKPLPHVAGQEKICHRWGEESARKWFLIIAIIIFCYYSLCRKCVQLNVFVFGPIWKPQKPFNLLSLCFFSPRKVHGRLHSVNIERAAVGASPNFALCRSRAAWDRKTFLILKRKTCTYYWWCPAHWGRSPSFLLLFLLI